MSLDFDDHNRTLEARVVNEIQEGMRFASLGVKEISKMVYIWLGETEGSLDECYKAILSYEDESDIRKRAILNRLSLSGGLINREDYMRLVFVLDHIVGYCAGTASRLFFLADWKPDKHTSDQIQLLIQAVNNSLDYLREAVFLLSTDSELSLQNALKVDESEKNIDQIYRELLGHIYKLDLDHKKLLMVFDFITHVEDISDQAESAADAVRIIAVGK